MKLHHLRTAFLVICWVFVCSQGRTTTFTTESEPINDGINALGNVKIEDSFIRTQDDGTININIDIICYDIANPNCFNNDTININTGTITNNTIINNIDINSVIVISNGELGEQGINNNDVINNNTDPAVPEPTTLSLLAMSLLLVGRRWR